ncbi:MAG: amino acid permease, partial [Gammaproteobacteria bacterium]|nr:amino acid permease [Gammaproteobacteria bacterium]
MWGGVVLGVGSMVGAGVFALLGVAATMAGSAIWLSFLAAGIIALLTGHSFAQLGVRYPSRGGVVEYLVRAYGTGWFSGGCSILFYIAQLIGMAMISMAFGRFMTKLIGLEAHDMVRLIGLEAHELFWERALGSGLLLVLTGLALVGSKLIRKTQRIFVVLNLTILAGFALALLGHAEVPRLAVVTW